MAPFQYDQYRNPYVGTAADLMLRQGDIEARRAEQQGAIWGGAVQQLGQIPGRAIEQQQQQRRIGQQDELTALKLGEAKREIAGQGAVDRLMAGDQLPPGAVGPRQENYLDENGLWKIPALHQALAQIGFGHMAPDLLQGAERINESITKDLALEQKRGESTTLLVGDLADSALKLSAIGMPLDAAMDFVVKPALATKRIKPEQYAQIRQQIMGLPPDQQRAALGQFRDAAAKLGGGETLGKDAARLDRYGRTIATNIVPDKPTEASLDADAQALLAKKAGGQALTATETAQLTAYQQRKTPPVAPVAAQTHNMRLAGVGDVPVDYVPNKDGTGGTWMYQGKDVTGKVTVIPSAAQVTINNREKLPPGNWDKSGEEFLATIPLQWRKTVEKIARYDEDPTKAVAARGGNRDMVMQWVNQVNPAYDSSQFSLRAPTRKAFTTGTQGQTLNALNTAIGHLDQLTGLVDQLGNGSFTPGNKIWNTVQTIFGSAKVTNFDTLKDALAGEVARTLSGGQATVSGIAEQRSLMNAYSSPEALAGYVKTLIPTLGSKLSNLDYQFHQAMGADDTFSALSPESKRILIKFGFDPAHPTITPGRGNTLDTKNAPPPAGGFTEGTVRPIPGFPGMEQTFTNGKWVRTK